MAEVPECSLLAYTHDWFESPASSRIVLVTGKKVMPNMFDLFSAHEFAWPQSVLFSNACVSCCCVDGFCSFSLIGA